MSAGGFDLFEDGVKVGKFAGLFFGMDELAIDADLKHAAIGRHQFERTDTLFQGR
jgi:hypothetical protein